MDMNALAALGLSQKIGPAEYVYSAGKLTQYAANMDIESLLAGGYVSPCEKPRAVVYRTWDGLPRWAIVLTDTALTPYV